MDPNVIRSYIRDAQYKLEQARQTRIGHEQDVEKYANQAADLEYQAQSYRKYAEDASAQVTSYVEEEQAAQRDIEYYATQLGYAEEALIRSQQNQY